MALEQKIQRIRLKNFRTYDNLELLFSKNIIIFSGENGSGKTSVLESIYMGSFIRTFRNSLDTHIIQYQKSFFYVEIEGHTSVEPFSLSLGYGSMEESRTIKSNVRKLKINEKSITKVGDFLAKFHCIVFVPDDVQIFDTMQRRRRFFDTMLSSLDKSYLYFLQSYTKTLKARNAYLREVRKQRRRLEHSFLKVYNLQLAEAGCQIMLKRIEFIQEFQGLFLEGVQKISNYRDNWNVHYVPSMKLDSITKESYLENLNLQEAKDLSISRTTQGIHQDNYPIYLQDTNIDMLHVASQGQKRTIALAFKMAHYLVTQDKIHCKPILLVDDILTELDVHRRQYFLQFLNKIGQVFITTTDYMQIGELLDSFNVFDGIQVFNFSYDSEGKTCIQEVSI